MLLRHWRGEFWFRAVNTNSNGRLADRDAFSSSLEQFRVTG